MTTRKSIIFTSLLVCFIFFLVVPLVTSQERRGATSRNRRPIPADLQMPTPNDVTSIYEEADKHRAKVDPEYIKPEPEPPPPPIPGVIHRGASDNVIYRCFFDEKTDANFDNWPDSWTRVVKLGFPEYQKIGIESLANPVNYRALRINIEGGSAQIQSPKVPVFPGLSYTAKSLVRTEGIQNSEVTMFVNFFDKTGRLAKKLTSAPIKSPNGWREVTIGPISAEFLNSVPRLETAATASALASDTDTVQIGFLVARGRRQDLQGNVDIAGVELVESPTVFLSAQSQNNIFTDPKGIEVTCRITGLSTLNNRLEFTLEDPFGNVIDKTTLDMKYDNSPDNTFISQQADGKPIYQARGNWQIPISAPGYYRVSVSTPGVDPNIDTNQLSLVVLQPQ
ncbi:MAG: hypothetical protein ACRC2T_02945, partial [Thermoguttaceae bacterium]